MREIIINENTIRLENEINQKLRYDYENKENNKKK